VTPTASRILFGVASGFFAVSFFQDTSYIFRYEYALDWLFYGGMVTTVIQTALLALPVFFVGKRVVAVISIVSVYFVQFLFIAVAILQDLEYIFESGIGDFIRYWVLPMFMVPSYAPYFSFDYLVLDSSAYIRLIGITTAIIGLILTFASARLVNQETVVSEKSSEATIFVAGRNSGKQSSHVNATEAMDQVERLGDFLKRGLITQEEFDFKKRQILGL
jgi:hypothetical protein